MDVDTIYIKNILKYCDLLFQRFLQILSTFKTNETNYIGIPESFNTNISHQLFNHTITFVNS